MVKAAFKSAIIQYRLIDESLVGSDCLFCKQQQYGIISTWHIKLGLKKASLTSLSCIHYNTHQHSSNFPKFSISYTPGSGRYLATQKDIQSKQQQSTHSLTRLTHLTQSHLIIYPPPNNILV